MMPVIRTYLPPESVTCDLNMNGTVLRMRMDTPLALEVKLDWYTRDTHDVLKRLCSAGEICVSCKNTTSADRSFKWEKTLPLLSALPIPLQFQVMKVIGFIAGMEGAPSENIQNGGQKGVVWAE